MNQRDKKQMAERKKKSVFIFGKTGRMGREVSQVVEKTPSLFLVGGSNQTDRKTKVNPCPDIVIDFSLPRAFSDLKNFIEQHNSCLVSGTTGLKDIQKKQLKDLAQKVPVFQAANMSFGVYLMTKLTEILSRYEKLYSYRIEETHHTHKKDTPSGTALLLEKTVKKFTSLSEPILSHRREDVFGIHRFIASSGDEQLEVQHRALN